MQRIIPILILGLFLVSCSQNLKLLLQINEEDKAFQKQLKLQEKGFSLLLKDLEGNRIKVGALKKDIITRYGEPILEQSSQEQPETQKLLYRYPTKYFDSPKVYLYFDSNQALTGWDTVNR